jgi:hypothetical protein
VTEEQIRKMEEDIKKCTAFIQNERHRTIKKLEEEEKKRLFQVPNNAIKTCCRCGWRFVKKNTKKIGIRRYCLEII